MGVTGSKNTTTTQSAHATSAVQTPKDDKYYDNFVPSTYHETKVPTMFRWPYGGRKVYIIGSFNNWSEKIPMSYNSEEEAFVVILNVSVGKHFYRVCTVIIRLRKIISITLQCFIILIIISFIGLTVYCGWRIYHRFKFTNRKG